MKRFIMVIALAMLGVMCNAAESVFLPAGAFQLATGNPSLVSWQKGAVSLPVWSLSGGTVGQSVAAVTPPLPNDCKAVSVAIGIVTSDNTTASTFSDVYRVHLSQLAYGKSVGYGETEGKPIRTALPDAPFILRRIVLETYCIVEPGLPLTVKIQRLPDDPGDTFTRPTGLVFVTVTPLAAAPTGFIVQDKGGYNSWPMMQAVGDKLVCAYSRGKGHNISEGIRGVYARTSADGGKSWMQEVCVADDPAYGEVTIGKGLDADGAMLLWIRCYGGPQPHHDLYRTVDGVTFTRVATPTLSPLPMQITDIIRVPSVGLMALWFAGDYGDNMNASWGVLTSADNGQTWTQRTVEANLAKRDWPTEPSAVYLGNGKILAIARTESGGDSTASQFQLTSTDNGLTWQKAKTNIRDVMASTPSLIFDPESGLLANYYYERGRGVIRRRVVKAAAIFDHPQDWPLSEAVGIGSQSPWDSGNVNATAIGRKHYLSYYSGKNPETAVLVLPVE